MGFEVSFLKFFEEFVVKQKKNIDKDYLNSGNKKGLYLNLRKNIDKIVVSSGNYVCFCKESEIFVQFVNLLQFQCSDNVKIVLDKIFKDCIEFVLKQFQEMKFIVSLKKFEVYLNDLDAFIMKEISIGKVIGRGQY